jgi:hydrogenase/urease accessory protein HupE
MAVAVYALCMLLSIGVAALLWRHYRRTGSRLLFWSALCFVGLTINNLLLVIDKVVLPGSDLSLARQVVALGALALLLFGLTYEDE